VPLVMFCLALARLALAQDVVLPEGKGREAVENACTVCHTAERITKQSLTVDQWRSEVRTMVENGASLNPDEWEPVVAYLAKNFGPKVNVNTSSAQEISVGLHLTQDEANSIVAYRTIYGEFKSLKDLAKVPQLDAKKIAAEENHIAF